MASGVIKADLAQITAAFTNAYLNVVQNLIEVEAPGYAFFGEKGDLVNWGKGHTATFPTRKNAKRGIVGGKYGRIPRGGAPTYDMASFKAKMFRLAIHYDWDALFEAENERYLANLVKGAFQDVKDQWVRRLNTYLYADTGLIGVLQAVSSTFDGSTANPLRVSLPVKDTGAVPANLGYGGLWLQAGDFIVINDPTQATIAEFRQVVSVDRSTYPDYASVELDQAVLATGTGGDDYTVGTEIRWASPAEVSSAVFNPASSDLVQDCDMALDYDGNKSPLPGLEEIITTSGSYLGIDTDDFWKSIVMSNSSTAGTPEPLDFSKIDEMLLTTHAQIFQRPDTLLVNPGLWYDWITEVTSPTAGSMAGNLFFNQKSMTPPGRPGVKTTYSSVEAVTGQGTVNVVLDPFCPPETIYGVDSSKVGYTTRHSLAMANEDGSDFRFPTSGYDDLQAFLRVVTNFVALHPGAVSKLGDIKQTAIAL